VERVVRRTRVPLGFVFAATFLVFARPTIVSMIWSLLLVAPGLALRAYAAGYVKKNAELTTTGPYAATRNPLYLGSFVAALGFVAASRNVLLVFGFLLLFAAVYLPVIRSEERFLAAHFPEFEGYRRAVPRLFPRPFGMKRRWGGAGRRTAAGIGGGSFSAKLYRRHREYNAAMGAAGLYAALGLLLWLRQHGIFPG